MITIFNRKELCMTYDIQEQAKLRDLLAQQNIDYQVKTINRNSPSVLNDTRARMGTYGQDMKYSNQYIFYVTKKQFQQACNAIGKKSS